VNLDAKRRERTRIEIKKLLRKFSITTLYVTHDQQEAVFMGDRIAVMRQGIIEQVGTFDELYYTPTNLFVATFIGSPPMNILSAAIGDRQITIGDQSWTLPDTLADTLSPGTLRIGVRPESWRLATNGGAPGAINHIERIPTERAAFIHGTLFGTNIVTTADIDQPEVKQISITPDWESAIFFEPEGEGVVYTPGVPEFF
jgi:ABC-type sugar transport system ATPase subunit